MVVTLAVHQLGDDGSTDLRRKRRDLRRRQDGQPFGHALDMIMLLAWYSLRDAYSVLSPADVYFPQPCLAQATASRW
jgi:hypothetical protein